MGWVVRVCGVMGWVVRVWVMGWVVRGLWVMGVSKWYSKDDVIHV